MPLLRSRTGAPMLTRAGGPLTNAPANIAAPALVTPPSNLLFDMGTGARKGWYGSNNQFANLETSRDWASNFADTANSFAGIRWQQTWLQVDGFYGGWAPAGGDVFRLYRKGSTGQDSHTIVMECGPNPSAVPVGDKVVCWLSGAPGSYDNGPLNLSGYNMPMKQKLTVTGGSASTYGDQNGRRIIELDAGVALPAFDYTPPLRNFGGGSSTVQHRHWSFYANSATKEMRNPIGYYCDITRNNIVANGGYAVIGGPQLSPTWVDRSREYRLIGGSLIEELYRLENEGLANYLGDTDPRLLAVELENEPTSEWHDVGEGPGYGDLLGDVWHGIARQVWGPSRTLIVKSSGFGGLNTLLSEFDFRSPDAFTHLTIHNYDNQISGPGGVGIYGWTDIGQTDWIADQVKNKINGLGYTGGGTTEIGVDAGRASGDADRGQRLGRILTSFAARNMYSFAWSMVGDAVRCSDIYNVGGKNIETFWPGLRPYARRAGIMTT